MLGSYDVVKTCEEFTGISPKVYKYRCDTLDTDISRFTEHPDIGDYLYHTKEGDCFEIISEKDTQSPIFFKPIETPGHHRDHLCFLLEEQGQETILFTGDHIIGARSVKRMTNVSKFLMAHSMSFEMKDLLVDAQSKVDEYITSREKKDRKLEKAAQALGKFTVTDLYEKMYQKKGKITPFAQNYMERILTRRLKKLEEENKLLQHGKMYEYAKL
eukprot:403336897